jgi:AAA family ATP:ADP antiporter
MSISFVQIQQAELIAAEYSEPAQRTKLFSQIDFAVNALTLLFQIFLTSHIIKWLGYRTTLLLIPLGVTIGFGLMSVSPILAVMSGVEIFRRAGDYAIMKPTREMLFSVVSREEKYKAKNFIDTTILRSGNMGSAWLYEGFRVMGIAATSIASISLALGTMWCLVAYWLGGQYQSKLRDKTQTHQR